MINSTYMYPPKEEKKYFSRVELIFFYSLLAAAVVFVYKKPTLAMPFFGLLLVLAWFSKKDYFWMAFFFLIIQEPAFIFRNLTTSHLPLLQVVPGLAVSPTDIFTVLIFLKAIMYKKKPIKLKLKTPFILLGVYFIFLFFSGTLFFNASIDTIAFFLRPVFYSIWIIPFITLIGTKDNLFKFLRLIFPMAFFLVFTQIYTIIQGSDFINFLDYGAKPKATLNSLTGETRAGIISGIMILPLSYIGALILTQFKDKRIGKKYLYCIIAVSFFSMFLSSNRTWIGVFLAVFVIFYFRQIKQLSKMLVVGGLIAIILFASVKLGVFSEDYLKNSLWGRASQIFQLFSGESEKVDHFSGRMENARLMIVEAMKSPFVGYGFSDISREDYNQDLGFSNTLLMGGLIGFALIAFLSHCYLRMMILALRKLDKGNPLRGAFKILILSFCAMLFVYGISWDIFGPFFTHRVTFLMVFFGISEILVRCSQECTPKEIEEKI